MKAAGLGLALGAGIVGAIASYFAAIVLWRAGNGTDERSATRPAWVEVTWPFPIDQWGKGRAVACKSADCGSAVKLYVRAKLGSCNCTTGVADDDDLDRMSDFDLIGGEVSPLGAGRGIAVGRMKGRSRAYTVTARNAPGGSAISVVVNDRCDMVVATALLPHDQPAAIEPAVMAFLNSQTILHWAEVALGI